MHGNKTFIINVVNPENREVYSNHSTFHEGDAGLDLFILEDQTIEPGQTALVDLGIQCQSVSFSWCVRNWIKGQFKTYHSYFLMPRSSIYKTPLLMKNSIGLVDSSYVGNIKAPLYNTSSEPFTLKKGERYVQLVNCDLSKIQFKLVDSLRNTTRGSGGFGSTNA